MGGVGGGIKFRFSTIGKERSGFIRDLTPPIVLVFVKSCSHYIGLDVFQEMAPVQNAAMDRRMRFRAINFRKVPGRRSRMKIGHHECSGSLHWIASYAARKCELLPSDAMPRQDDLIADI